MATKLPTRREDEKARVALGGLEMTCDAEPDEEADVHAGVIPEKCSFAARILRREPLREHHIDAGDVEAAAGEEEREADVEQGKCAGRDACAAEHLQRHASDKQVAVREEAAAQVTAEEVQAVVERAEDTHQGGGLLSRRDADASSRRGRASSRGQRSRVSRKSG